MIEAREVPKRTVEEIADMLAQLAGPCGLCPIRSGCKKNEGELCFDGWVAWLRGEVNED